MGKEEFAKVLEGIVNDSDEADRVAGGDFADLGEGDLTASERALLSAAAGDLDDDVTGFAINAFLKLQDIDGESERVIPKVENFASPNVRAAFSYLKIGDIQGE